MTESWLIVTLDTLGNIFQLHLCSWVEHVPKHRSITERHIPFTHTHKVLQCHKSVDGRVAVWSDAVGWWITGKHRHRPPIAIFSQQNIHISSNCLGTWQVAPSTAPDPSGSAFRTQMSETLLSCSRKLPRNTSSNRIYVAPHGITGRLMAVAKELACTHCRLSTGVDAVESCFLFVKLSVDCRLAWRKMPVVRSSRECWWGFLEEWHGVLILVPSNILFTPIVPDVQMTWSP